SLKSRMRCSIRGSSSSGTEFLQSGKRNDRDRGVVSRRRVKTMSNPNNKCMKTNTVDHGKAKAAPGNTETMMRRKWSVLGLLFVVFMFGAAGCPDYKGGCY